MKEVVSVKEYFIEPSKMKKLAIITLIIGISLGTIVLAITAICESKAKNRAHNGLLHKIVDKVDNYSNDMTNNPYYNDFNEMQDDIKNATKKTLNAYGDIYRIYKYTPYYFIGGFIICISVGSSVTLIILAKIKENKQGQVKQ